MDRNAYAPGHRAAIAIAEAEEGNEFGRNAAFGAVRVFRFELEREGERRIHGFVRPRLSAVRTVFAVRRGFARFRVIRRGRGHCGRFLAALARWREGAFTDFRDLDGRGAQIHAFQLGNEFEDVATFVATEAVKNLPFKLDAARRFGLTMERA